MIKTYKSLTAIVMATVLLMASFMVSPLKTYAQLDNLSAESAILVDATTGEVLYAKNADEALPPASMTKMMTEYLVLEAIEEGEISWDTRTEISEYAYSISANNSFSGVGLRLDHEYTVEQLYEAMAINSDNATSIALAELIAGSEGEFVKLMNQKAEEMGLPDAKFVNSTGLDNKDLNGKHPEGTKADDTNLLSARSTAMLAYHLVNDFDQALEISSIPKKEFEDQEMVNWNWMLPGMDSQNFEQFTYEGMDGLKTGFTDLAGYSFAGTAKQDDTRLISVVMRTDSIEERFNQTAKLLDYGFNDFSRETLYEAGHQIEGESTIPVYRGKQDTVQIESAEAIEKMVRNGDQENYSVSYEFDEEMLNEEGELKAPVEKGTEVGRMVLTYSGDHDYGNIDTQDQESISVPLVTSDDVEQSNWFVRLFLTIGDFFVGLFDSIKGLFS
ncbi:D-alanyl-D-alanine carboxypeptidase family protein [Allobacillus halotolerans]|uniref:D-alanyl-D-alanine carboxypeptidase n=1 Tax=Allobacillus halotolerans TaxID=570278 RepID=A0ABS6GLU2_9BACI|nr:D-alanyl-D-alanine carboxypeptidase family protein [Allobacillus halotolerans]MBU6080072.1 D-alanyl-D-alanine carboxypeptidase [Allobacillus halotolerans]